MNRLLPGPAALRTISPSRFLRAGLLSLALLASFSPSPAAARQSPEAVEAAVRSLLERETLGQPGEVRINVRAFDPANQLPPCAALEAFLQPGTRAWGQITVGVRCDAPTAWTAWAQATVQVFGPYLVTTRALRSAEVIGEADVEVREGELSALPDNVLSAPEQAVGHVTRFAQAAGAPLRAGSLRQADAVRRGQTVLVTTRGPGFTVSGEGQALNGAAAGERIRIRLGNGQIVQGLVRPDGTVDVDF